MRRLRYLLYQVYLIAVSGLHISILFGLVYAAVGMRRWLTPFVMIPVLVFFAAITGFTPSVTRACIMSCMSCLAWSVNAQYDPPTGLAAACLGMMAANPFAVLSVSFQLSVSSVAGIILFCKPILNWFMKRASIPEEKSLKTKLLFTGMNTIAVSMSAMAFAVPFSAYYFGTISLAAPITNFLTLWCVSLIFIGTGLTCVFGWFSMGLAKGLAWVLNWLIRYVMAVAKLIAAVPFAAVYTKSVWIVIWIGFVYALAAVYLTHRRRYAKYYLAAALLGLSLSAVLSWGIPRSDSVRLTVLPVGEGQSILLQSKGKTIVIDCGGNDDSLAANIVSETLLSQGIFRVDSVVLTHYDRDHAGALANFLTRISAEHLFFPNMDDKGIMEAVSAVTDTEAEIIIQDTAFPFGTGKVTLFKAGTLKTENENCMCVLFESENCDILITGDRNRSGEKHLLEEAHIPDVDVLIAGHHGSKNATSYELLEAVRPEIVVVSAGKNNSYGHPAAEVLERLKEYNCTVYRTDLDGTVCIRR